MVEALPFPKTSSRRQAPRLGRVRSPKHMGLIGGMACCICGRRPAQVHHLIAGPEPKARGLKAGDNWTIPLCVIHHTELHANGDERGYLRQHAVDGQALAAELWARPEPDF